MDKTDDNETIYSPPDVRNGAENGPDESNQEAQHGIEVTIDKSLSDPISPEDSTRLRAIKLAEEESIPSADKNSTPQTVDEEEKENKPPSITGDDKENPRLDTNAEEQAEQDKPRPLLIAEEVHARSGRRNRLIRDPIVPNGLKSTEEIRELLLNSDPSSDEFILEEVPLFQLGVNEFLEVLKRAYGEVLEVLSKAEYSTDGKPEHERTLGGALKIKYIVTNDHEGFTGGSKDLIDSEDLTALHNSFKDYYLPTRSRLYMLLTYTIINDIGKAKRRFNHDQTLLDMAKAGKIPFIEEFNEDDKKTFITALEIGAKHNPSHLAQGEIGLAELGGFRETLGKDTGALSLKICETIVDVAGVAPWNKDIDQCYSDVFNCLSDLAFERERSVEDIYMKFIRARAGFIGFKEENCSPKELVAKVRLLMIARADQIKKTEPILENMNKAFKDLKSKDDPDKSKDDPDKSKDDPDKSKDDPDKSKDKDLDKSKRDFSGGRIESFWDTIIDGLNASGKKGQSSITLYYAPGIFANLRRCTVEKDRVEAYVAFFTLLARVLNCRGGFGSGFVVYDLGFVNNEFMPGFRPSRLALVTPPEEQAYHERES